MKLVIAGSRSVTNKPLVFYEASRVHDIYPVTEVVSGCARGVDTLGEQWADVFGVAVKRFPVTKSDWERIGPSAGHRRNKEMADYADAVLAVWDGKSSGTKSMIKYALDRNLLLFVYTCVQK